MYICQLSFQYAYYFVGIMFFCIITVYFVSDTNCFKEDKVIVPVHIREELAVAGVGTDEKTGPSSDLVKVDTSEIGLKSEWMGELLSLYSCCRIYRSDVTSCHELIM